MADKTEYVENETDNFYESILISGSSELDDYRNAVEISKFESADSCESDEIISELDVSKYFN